MDAKRARKLKKMGGRVTTVKDFLGLTAEDMAVIEARLGLDQQMAKARTVNEPCPKSPTKI